MASQVLRGVLSRNSSKLFNHGSVLMTNLSQSNIADDISQHLELPRIHHNSNLWYNQTDLLTLRELGLGSRAWLAPVW